MKKLCSFTTTLLLAILLFLLPKSNFATHIVGGEMSYRCLGGFEYEISLNVYRDCFYGAANAEFDHPASIGIFDRTINTFRGELRIGFIEDDTLDAVLSHECLFFPEDVCVHTTNYKDTVTLQPSSVGYKFVYQRCCRNQTINNIIAPEETGATYSIDLTPEAMAECNTSPVFNAWPPIFICVNNPIYFDHSASDEEGDSLVYKLCTPFDGATSDFPRPQPPNFPPYDTVVYQMNFGLENLLGGGGTLHQPLTIHPKTGILTGFPTVQGQYVVGVCVEEYRNDALISETRRDFQYNIGQCEEVVADFISSDEPECDGLTLEFTNMSHHAEDFIWYFDYPNTSMMSTDEHPMFTYSEGGQYEIALIASPNSNCVDTLLEMISLENNNCPLSIAAYWPNFKVQLNDKKQGILNWTSTSEHNYFEIERSNNGYDFVTIGKIDAKNNVNSFQRYDYIDAHLLHGSNYYRIRQVDLIGKSTYSTIEHLQFDEYTFSIQPNPVKDEIHLQFEVDLDEQVQIEIFNTTGQLIYDAMHQVNSGGIHLYFKEMNIQHSGLYWVRAKMDKNIFIPIPIIKVK